MQMLVGYVYCKWESGRMSGIGGCSDDVNGQGAGYAWEGLHDKTETTPHWAFGMWHSALPYVLPVLVVTNESSADLVPPTNIFLASTRRTQMRE